MGFYGGINYGFGYFGLGFVGGRWDGGHFFYNRAVLNVNVEVIHNVYNTIIHETVSHVSYNGGNGGIDVRPRPEEEAAAHDRHIGPVPAQTQQIQAARSNPQLRASVNMGKPTIAATARPGEFGGRDVVPAREAGGSYAPGNRGGNVPKASNPVHPHDLPPVERPAAPNTGNPKQDQKYQQQDKLIAKQNQEREKLQQDQEKEHQQQAKQSANQAKQQESEQKHQQQTQQLQQKHVQQQFQQKTQKSQPHGK